MAGLVREHAHLWDHLDAVSGTVKSSPWQWAGHVEVGIVQHASSNMDNCEFGLATSKYWWTEQETHLKVYRRNSESWQTAQR